MTNTRIIPERGSPSLTTLVSVLQIFHLRQVMLTKDQPYFVQGKREMNGELLMIMR